jgi:sterol 3beta-glucosyltransferase
MHITITAPGSRSDVQPCMAVGVGLKQADHQVRIATYGAFADLVGHYGLEFASTLGDPL